MYRFNLLSSSAAPCALALALGVLSSSPARAQFTYTENFKNDTAPGWNFFTGSSSPGPRLTSGATGVAGADPEGAATLDPSGAGWLRLATATTQQANAVYFDTPIPSAGNEVKITFNVNLWGGNNFNGTGADGLSFFLYDASVPFSVGAFGGSLGYAQKDTAQGADTTQDGLGGGFVGIALDAYGNFSRLAEGREGGTSALAPNSVSVRGPGSGQDGYNYLAGTTGSNGTLGYDYTDTGDPTVRDAGDSVVGALPYTLAFANATARPNQSTQYRTVEFTLTETSQIIIRIQFGEDGLWYDVLSTDISSFVRPEQLRFGFSAGTGAGTQVYEVGGLLSITATAGSGSFVWDNGLGPGDLAAGNSVWGTGANDPLNWAGQTNPTLKSNILFTDAYVTSPQNIDLQGSDKVIKNLFISGNQAYTLSTTEARKLIFDSDTVGGLTTLSLTPSPNGDAAHTIGVDLQLNRTLDINNTIAPAFTINGGIDTNGNALNFKGTGTTAVTGVISGSGALTKQDGGATILGGASANTYTGATTVTGGTLQIEKAGALGSTAAGTTVNSGGTLALAGSGTTFAAESLTLNGTGVGGNGALRNTAGNNTWTGATSLASASTVGVDGSTSLAVSGVVTGAGDLTKAGAGTLTLSGTNTYTGATNINAGTLAISNENNLGANPGAFNAAQLNLNGGTLRTQTSTVTIDDANRGVTIAAAGGTFDTQSNLVIASAVAGTGALNKTGAGTLTLSGTNTHSGAVNLTAGTLAASGGSAIGDTSAVTISSGATFNTTGSSETVGSIAGAGGITLGTGATALTVGGNNASTAFSGVISGGANADLVKTGAGTLTLTGANTFTGDLQVNQGAVALGASNTLADTSTLVLNGGTFAVGGSFSDTIGRLTLSSSSTIDYGSNTSSLVFTNATRTAGTLTLDNWAGDPFGAGASQLTFTSGADYTAFGSANINFSGWGAGSTRLSSGEIVPNTGGTIYTYALTGGGNWNVDNNWSDNGLPPNADPGTFASAIGDTAILGSAATGPATISLNGADRTLGYLVFNSNQNYTVSGNNLVFDVNSGLAQLTNSGSGAQTVSSGLRLNDALNIFNNGTGSLTLSGGITNNSGTNNLTVGGAGDTTLSGNLTTGAGTLTKNGSGILTLGGATSTYTGGTTINDGMVRVSADRNLGATTGAVTLNGGTLENTASFTLNSSRILTLGASGGTIDTNSGTTLTFGGVVAGAGTLTKADAGTLTLSGANTHTGGVVINGGTLITSGGSSIGNAALVTINSGTWQTNSSETVGNIAGTGSLVFGGTNTLTFGDATSQTFSGIISDGANTGTLVKQGSGTVILDGANTYKGATTINAGVLNVRHNTALGTTAGGTTVASGAALELESGTGLTIGAEALSLAGTGLGGNGALRNISGANSFAGNLTLTANTEIQSDAGTLALSGTINGDAASRTLAFDGAGNTTVSNIIGANVSTLAKAGAGTLTLSGANTYTGATAVNAGTVVVSNTAGLGAAGSGTTIADGATLSFSSGGALTVAENLNVQGQGVASAGAIRNLAGNTTLSGAINLDNETYIGAASGTTLTASNTISGTGFGLTKVGDGTLVLSGANTYTGTTAINAGTLVAQNAGALGGGTNPTTVADGATLALSGTLATGEAVTLTGSGVGGAGALQGTSGTTTLSGNISMTGNSTIGVSTGASLTASGIVGDSSGNRNLVKAGDGTLVLSGANTYTGTTTIRGGTLVAGSDSPATGNGAFGNASSALQLGDASTTGGANLALLAGGASGGTDIDRQIAVNNFGATTTLGGTNTSGANTFNGGIALSKSVNLTSATGGTVGLTGPISGTGGLTANGTGTVVLSGANTYSGATTVNSGATLVAASSTALGATAAGATVSSGGTLGLQGGIALASGETLSLSGAGVGGNGALGNLSGDNSVAGAITLAGNTTLGSAAGTLTLSGAIGETGGSRSVTTTGAGNLSLTGASTFSGTLTVGGTGTLTLANNGGQSLGGVTGITVSSGATLALGASNQINDSVTLTLAGGTFSAGGFSDTMRQLVQTSASTIDYLNDGGVLRFDGVNGVSAGLGTVTGTLSITNWGGSLDGSGAEQLVVYSNSGPPVVTNITFADWGNATTVSRAGDLGAGYYEIVPNITAIDWNVDGNGNFNTAGNWSPSGVPGVSGINSGNSSNAIVRLGNTITAAPLDNNPTITMNTNRSIGTLVFDNDNNRNYTISGGNTLSFNPSSGNAQIVVADNGSHTISATTRLWDNTVITNNSSATTGLTLSGTVSLRASQDLTFAGSGTTNVSGTLSRSAGVTNLIKTGSGTLILGGTNTYTGTTTLRNGTIEVTGNAPSGASGNLGNATSTVVINDASTTASMNTALLMTDADGGSTVARNLSIGSQGATTTLGGTNTSGTNTFSGAIALGKDVTLTAAAGGTVVFSNVLSGAGGLTKVGDGTVTLSGTGTNTNTGNVTVSAGTLSINKTGGANRAIGDNAAVTVASGANLVFAGGQSETIGSLAGAGSVNNSNASALTLTTGGNNATTTFSGVISDPGGNLALVKTGAGTLTLSGANTYDGDTTVSAGTLVAAHSTALGNTTGNTSVAAGATLALTGNITVAAGEDLTLAGAASPSTASLANLAGTNTYAGLVTLTGGAGDDVKFDAATGTQLTLSGAIGETGGAKDFAKTGAGTIVLSGANTYTGTTNITAGTLVAAHDNALGATAAGTSVQIGASLGFQGGITVGAAESLTVNTTASPASASLRNLSGTNTAAGAVSLSGGVNTGAFIDSNSGSLTLSGAITSVTPTNNNFLTKTGSGSLTLSGAGANTFAGSFTVNDGATVLNKTAGANATGTGQLVIGDSLGAANSAVVQLAAANQINDTSDVLIRTDGRLDLQANSDTIRALTLEGGQVTTTGAGTLTLGGNLTFTGTGASTAAINGNLDLGGSRIVQVGNNAVNGDSDLTLNGIVSGAGHTLIKNDLGTLELAGTAANTFTGGLTLNDGTVLLNKTAGTAALAGGAVAIGDGAGAANTATLRLAAANQINDLSAVVLASDGRFDTASNNETVGSIAGSGSILIGTGQLLAGGNDTSTTFSGSLTGTGLLQKEGTGTLTIASNLGYSGDINLNAGALQFDASNAFTGNLTVLAGTTLRLTDSTVSLNNLTFAGTGNVTIDFAGTASTLSVLGNLDIGAGVTITVRNWQNASDFWFAQNWTGAVTDVRGLAPMNRITFDSDGVDPTTWTNNDTIWQDYDRQITPVPEPSTYGALLLGLSGAFLGWRRWKQRKNAAIPPPPATIAS